MSGPFRGRFCIAGFLTACAFGAASAADLPPSMVTKAPLAPLQPNWSGFYGGVNVGGSFGQQRSALDDAITNARLLSNPLLLNGAIGGGQIGYNWQPINRPWVFGVEADIQGSGQKSNGTFPLAGITAPGDSIAYQNKLDWFGTLRGRIGWQMGEQGNWLPYVTGGLAYGQGTLSGNGIVGGVPLVFDNTHTYAGWVLGAGLEWTFWDRWSAKAEYLYMDFGRGQTIGLTPTLNFHNGRMTDQIGRGAVNYHF